MVRVRRYWRLFLSCAVARKAPLGVARRLFGMTKLLSSRLDWRFFRLNSGDHEASTEPSQTPLRRMINRGRGTGIRINRETSRRQGGHMIYNLVGTK